MCAELECGVCYQSYNTGRRCPMELSCRHTFCENCVSSMARQSQLSAAEGIAHAAQSRCVACPLCRRCTLVPASCDVRRALRVDEEVLGRMLAAGFPDVGDENDGECGAADKGEPRGSDPSNPNVLVETEAARRTGKFRLWCALKRMCTRLCRNNSHDSPRQRTHRMTNEELKDLALMSCYMM